MHQVGFIYKIVQRCKVKNHTFFSKIIYRFIFKPSATLCRLLKLFSTLVWIT